MAKGAWVAEPETTITEDDDLLASIRASGELGPFRVADRAGESACGRREHNEDRWRVDRDAFVVADGMGGHAGGALAAQVAVDIIHRELPTTEPGAIEPLMSEANSAVKRAGAAEGFDRLGTTVVALVNRRTHVDVLSCGDSRVYRFRSGSVDQLTQDHTVRNELRAAGVSEAEAVAANVRLDALTAFVGMRNRTAPSFRFESWSVNAGDRFLLCSDGVHGVLSETELARHLASTTCADAAGALIDAALVEGIDNATAVVVSFAAEELR